MPVQIDIDTFTSAIDVLSKLKSKEGLAALALAQMKH